MIYLDNAATTQPKKQVVEAMLPYLEEKYANPSSMYEPAIENQRIIGECRQTIARTIGAEEKEIYFTSGGSEADNWVLKGVAHANRERGKHIITTQIEHHAILNACHYLEEEGFQITYLGTDQNGQISLRELEDTIREDTILISIMAANNEIGTLEPVREIGRIAKEHGCLFHTDAVQMYGQLPINVKFLGADLMSASAHKFSGPRGCGFLYVREGVKICPLIHGGGQERHMRAGTENTAAIVGMAEAAKLASQTMQYRIRRETYHRNYLIGRVLREISGVHVTGHRKQRLPGSASFWIEGIEGESLLILLDMKGICASAGSACTTGNTEASHVLRAIGLEEEQAKGSLRVTINENVSIKDLDYFIEILKESIESLRNS